MVHRRCTIGRISALSLPHAVANRTYTHTMQLPQLTTRALVVRIDARTNLGAVEAMPRGPQRRVAAYDALVATARATQRAALDALVPLQASGVVRAVRSLVAPNALIVDVETPAGQEAVRAALAGVAHVGEIRTNARFLAPPPLPTAPIAAQADAGIVDPPHSWALDAIGAEQAWRSGGRGAGITIGVIDTGADITHPALRTTYRGSSPTGARTDDYNWFDGIDGTAAPSDTDGHGTQVASIATAPAIGVAPGARFIAARAIANGLNSTVATLEALQWMLAPTKADGSDPRPELGADIVNNSWGTSNGSDEFLRESYEVLRSAGILVVTATGNSGPGAGTISAPASYPGFVSVGATDRLGELADFSSRGPSPLPDASGARTPLVVAPGLMVPAAKAGAGYVYASGTSIAAPVVAGALAVLLEAAPHATQDQLLDALTSTATDIAAPGADDASGFGRINLAAAVEHIRGR